MSKLEPIFFSENFCYLNKTLSTLFSHYKTLKKEERKKIVEMLKQVKNEIDLFNSNYK